jgi:hypothetical protein
MLQYKDIINISELNGFFTSSKKFCETVLWIICSLKLMGKRFELNASDHSIYGPGAVLTFLLLFPLLQLPNVRALRQSVLAKLFRGGKDVFYRLKNNEMINWRFLHYRVILQLIRLAKSCSTQEVASLRCLIADDTDLPKTGRCIEQIGRIWSHVSNSSITFYAFNYWIQRYRRSKSNNPGFATVTLDQVPESEFSTPKIEIELSGGIVVRIY